MKNLWGTPPKIRGTYGQYDYAPRGSFGPREAGSVLDDAAMTALIIAPLAFEIEQLAQKADVGASPGLIGLGSGVLAFVMKVALKIVANYLRRNGASWLRDFGAWLWVLVGQWFGWTEKQDEETTEEEDKPGVFKRLFGWRKGRRWRRTQ